MRDSGAHTGPEGRGRVLVVPVQTGTSHPCSLSPYPTPKSTTTAHYAIAPIIATLFAYVVPVQAPSFQRTLESSVRDSGAHTGPEGRGRVLVVPVQTGTSHPCSLSPYPTPKSTTTAHYAIAPIIATLFAYVVPVQAPSFQRRLESSVRDSGAHTGPEGRGRVLVVPVQTGTSHPCSLSPYPTPKSTTTAHYAIAPIIATLFTYVMPA